jgi:hypothetical protein
MQWLCLAQDACEGKGVSSFYGLVEGWDLPYPETTGYIIGTFLAYGNHFGEPQYIERAIRMGDWEIEIQDPSGGVLSRIGKRILRVFNTGQVVLGWCALFEQTLDKRYLEAAIRAGNYLLQKQERNGSWIQDSNCGARTYYSRVDWALLRLAMLTGDMRFSEAAIKHLSWVLKQQTENGWFRNCGFWDDLPITHVIAYTLRGLIESHVVAEEAKIPVDLGIVPAVCKAADNICAAGLRGSVRGVRGLLPTHFNEKWETEDHNSCLTGNVQLSGVLRRINKVVPNADYLRISDMLLDASKRVHVVQTRIKEVRGAVPGSFPFYEGYDAYLYPNWATKFMADALMMRIMGSIDFLVKA